VSGSYKLEELRLVQERSGSSALNGLYCQVGTGVPEGKLWIVLSAGYMPDAAETQVISFQIINLKTSSVFSVLNPVSMNLNPAKATFIEQGMEYMLLPGDIVQARRVANTAGSTMTSFIRFIEIDLPLYTYDEPQVVRRQQRAISSIRSAMGGGSGRSGAGSAPTGGRPGGGGGPLPV
jgi:hypothetical protein